MKHVDCAVQMLDGSELRVSVTSVQDLKIHAARRLNTFLPFIVLCNKDGKLIKDRDLVSDAAYAVTTEASEDLSTELRWQDVLRVLAEARDVEGLRRCQQRVTALFYGNDCKKSHASPGPASLETVLARNIVAGDECGDTVRALIAAGANVNAVIENTWHPLTLACCYGRYKISKLLLECGADVNVKDPGGYTALILAADKMHGATVDLLISHGADVNACTDAKLTPLICASINCSIEIVDALMHAGARVEYNDCDFGSNQTALICAVQYGSSKVVDMLISHEINVNECNAHMQTALHVAAEHGHVAIVASLIRCGSDVNAQDEDKNTPLHLAALHGHYDVCLVLLEAGSTVKPRNVRGLTPAECAHSAADGPGSPSKKTNSVIFSCTAARESRYADIVNLLTSFGGGFTPKCRKKKPGWYWTVEQADYFVK